MKWIVVFTMLICTSVFAIDDQHFEMLKNDINSYLKSTEKSNFDRTVSQNKRKLSNKIDQKCKDNNALNEQSALNAILIDWFNDHKKELENHNRFDKETLKTGCLMIKYVFDCEYNFPEDVTKEFTNSDVEEFCKFLKDKIKEQK